MKMKNMDPEHCRNHMLVIKCARDLVDIVPSAPEGADGILAYCYLDPLRGYRLLLCTLVKVKPFHIYDDCYISIDISYWRLGGEEAEIYPKKLSELRVSLQKIIYEVKRSVINNTLTQLRRLDLEDWKIIRKNRQDY